MSDTTPEYIRATPCPYTGKFRFTEAEAKKAVRRIRTKRTDPVAYRCRWCHMCHVASDAGLRHPRGGAKAMEARAIAAFGVEVP